MHIFKYGLLVALLSFSVWASEASKQSCQIQVSITGQEKVPGDVRLYLYQDGQVIKKLKVKKDGTVRADVPPGSYQMLVSSSDMTIAGSRTAYLDTARENCAESLFVQKSQGTTIRGNAPSRSTVQSFPFRRKCVRRSSQPCSIFVMAKSRKRRQNFLH
jgi:hypothetical protein